MHATIEQGKNPIPEEDRIRCSELFKKYGVSAVFAGHLHELCGKVGYEGIEGIPTFLSGASSFQNYLVVDFDLTKKTMTVRRREAPYPGIYRFVDDQKWEEKLNISTTDLAVPRKGGYENSLNFPYL